VRLFKADLSGTTLSHADLTDAILTEANLDGAILTNAVLASGLLDFTSLRHAMLDEVQAGVAPGSGARGANFTGATSVEGASFQNAAFSTSTECLAGGTEPPPCTWSFTEQDGTPVIVAYGATVIGALATDPSMLCPDGEDGPCTPAKLTPMSGGPFPPVPACVPAPPKFCNCIPVDQGGCKPSQLARAGC
jgi:hypothetical protein